MNSVLIWFWIHCQFLVSAFVYDLSGSSDNDDGLPKSRFWFINAIGACGNELIE